jgi:hypothetical protein
MIEIKGIIMGVKLSERSFDNHIKCTLLTEDDEYWTETDVSFSSYWIDDYIQTLQKVKEFLLTQEPDIYSEDNRQYGWKFKK